MFSIRKKHKVQALLYFTHPDSWKISEKINPESRRLHSNFLAKVTNIHTEKMLNQEPTLEAELDNFWIQELRNFFISYPSAWYDLKRKIHAHKTMHGNNLCIHKKDEPSILCTFLRLNWVWQVRIDTAIRREVFENQWLLRNASDEPSLLDCSHGEILNIEGHKRRKDFIKRIIEHGLKINSWASWRDYESHARFTWVYKEVLHFLKSIFWITFNNIPRNITIWSLSEYITQEIWDSEHGMQAKKAWMLAKSFTAWWSIPEIISVRNKWVDNLPKILNKLEALWVRFQNNPKNGTMNPDWEETQITSWQLTLTLDNWQDFNCMFEYRIKSLRSILLKMWESEEYNTVDAMRDIIGLAIVWPDNTPKSIKTEIISKFTWIMWDRTYILKNKGMIWKDELGVLKKRISDWGNSPIWWIDSGKKGKTSSGFINASISGFTEVEGWEFAGLEVQFFDKSWHDYWRNDHYTYDPLKIISAWSRWSWFMTPRQVIYCIQREIPENIRNDLLRKRPQGIFYDYLKSGILVAYKWEGTNDIYIVPSSQEQNFSAKFKSWSIRKIRIGTHSSQRITQDERRNSDKFREFILELNTYDLSTF